MKRFQFIYPTKEALKDKFCICCNLKYKNKRIRKQLFEYGKEKVEKHLDVITLIRNMREMKMVWNLTLNKSQRKLLPFMKNHMIESRFNKKQIK